MSGPTNRELELESDCIMLEGHLRNAYPQLGALRERLHVLLATTIASHDADECAAFVAWALHYIAGDEDASAHAPSYSEAEIAWGARRAAAGPLDAWRWAPRNWQDCQRAWKAAACLDPRSFLFSPVTAERLLKDFP